MGGKPKAIRRTASEARERILDTAEEHLRDRGPDGLRLQALAQAVGVSHPAILHHFGSRTGLVQAVIKRASDTLTADVMQALAADEVNIDGSAALLDRIFATLADRGRARTLAWLLLTPKGEGSATLGYGAHLAVVASALHRQRELRQSTRPPPYEDTLFTVLLASLATIGNALAGESLRKSAGLEQARDEKRFVAWFAKLLHEHIEKTAA